MLLHVLLKQTYDFCDLLPSCLCTAKLRGQELSYFYISSQHHESLWLADTAHGASCGRINGKDVCECEQRNILTEPSQQRTEIQGPGNTFW